MATSQYSDPTDKPAPERGPRRGQGKMKDDEFRSLVASLVREAQSHAQALDADRETATEFFQGKPIGNEKEGRSKVVITEVRDKVLGVMPDLMALLFGPDRAVEYIPTSASKVDAVEQISDFVSKVVIEIDNAGFMQYHAALLDGLVRRLGGFKWWYEHAEPKTYSKSGLTREQLVALLSEDGVELVKDSLELSDLSQPGQAFYDLEFTREDKDGRARFMAIPPEELIFLPSTRDPQSALFIGHILEKTRGELIDLGISEKEIDEYGAGSGDSELETDPMKVVRMVEGLSPSDSVQAGETNKKTLFVESYTRLDFDGDGTAELRKVCTIGPGFYPVINKPVDEAPISVFCPIPEPHTLVGQSYADLTMDIQRIKSAVTRGILDSLSTAIFPRTWFKENDANISDVMSTDVGAPIRTRTGQGAVGTFQHTFVAKDAFPLLQYFDELSEKRTGNPGAQGIDMDALQSTTKSAADAAVGANRKHTELVARFFAEMALKPMYRGIYNMMKQHQPRARMVRLRERWVEVDPRSWDDDLDVQVNVALGQAPREYKLATLAGFKATQEAYLQQLGGDNPLVGLGNLRYTLGKMAELSGFPDSTRFFKELPLDWTPPPPPPGSEPPPSPEMALVQVEAQKAQAQIQAKQIEQQMKMQEMQAEHQLKMQQLQLESQFKLQQLQAELSFKERELALKEIEISAKYNLEAAKVDAQVEKLAAETRTKEAVAAHDAEIKRDKADHDMSLKDRSQARKEAE